MTTGKRKLMVEGILEQLDGTPNGCIAEWEWSKEVLCECGAMAAAMWTQTYAWAMRKAQYEMATKS